MKNKTLMIASVIVLFLGLFGALAAPAPAQAFDLPAQETTPVAPGDDPIVVTQVIPETGGNNNDDVAFTSTWLLLVIVGVALIALIIGLLARGSHTHHID